MALPSACPPRSRIAQQTGHALDARNPDGRRPRNICGRNGHGGRAHRGERFRLSRRPGGDAGWRGHPDRDRRPLLHPHRPRRCALHGGQCRRRAERTGDRPRWRALSLQQRRRQVPAGPLDGDRPGRRLRRRLHPAHRSEDRRHARALHARQRPQAVGAERPGVRHAGRLLFHRSRQALRAHARPRRAVLRDAGRLEGRRGGLSDPQPQRLRPLAGRQGRSMSPTPSRRGCGRSTSRRPAW